MDAALGGYEPRTATVRVETPSGPGAMTYLDFGDADRPVDVVFLHANGFNARSYRSILAPLADRLRIVAPDQRGHGATALGTATEGRTSWHDMKDDLLAFLAAMKLGRVALAGHSMGGTASLLAAAEAPEKVRALALFDPVVLPRVSLTSEGMRDAIASPLVHGALKRRRAFPSRQAVIDAYRGRGAFRTWTEEMLADYVTAGFNDLPDGTVELACSPEWEVSNYVSQAHDSWAAFERSICPIHILKADTDSTGRLDEGLEPLIAAGRVRIEVIPGTTHFLPMERPDLVSAALLEAAAAP